MRKGAFVAVLLLIAAVLLILASFETLSLIPSSNNMYDVLCEAQIGNALLQDAKINDVSCLVKPSSILPFSVANTFSLYDTGNARLEINDRSALSSFSVIELGTATVNFRLDRLPKGDTTATFKLFNENGGLIDTKSIPLKIGG